LQNPYEVLDRLVLDTLLDFKEEVSWRFEFRGSSLPSCPRALMFGLFHKPTPEEFPKKFEDFTTRYNFKVGHAIHALVQQTWASQGLLWGDWQCNDLANCGVTFQNTRLPKGRCLRCHEEATYVEKHLKDPLTGFSGHCDGVVFSEQLNGYFILELKTRNQNVIQRANQPYESDLYQVSAYATLISQQFWVPVVGRLILWIGKPRPKPYKMWFYEGTGSHLFDEERAKKVHLDECLKRARPEDVHGVCEHISDGDDCPWQGICFSPKREKIVKAQFEAYKKFLEK